MQSQVSMSGRVHAPRRAPFTITITNNARKYLGCDGDGAIRERTNPSVAYHIFPYNKQPFGRSTILLFHLLLIHFSFTSPPSRRGEILLDHGEQVTRIKSTVLYIIIKFPTQRGNVELTYRVILKRCANNN